MTISVFDYLEYQKYLQDYLELQKKEKTWFSIRYLAGRIGMDHGNFIKVLQGSRHLSPKTLTQLIVYLKLNAKEIKYLKTLVAFNKSKSDEKSKKLFNELLAIKNIPKKKIKAQEYEYYQSWYHSAIFSLLDYYKFKGDFKALAKQLDPPISVEEAKGSIELMLKLGLLGVNEKGEYFHTHKVLTTGEKWHSMAVQNYQEETIKLSNYALLNHPRNSRDISTLTMNISKDDLKAIQSIISECRRSIIEVVHESQASDRVYQLNMQFFPLTKRREGPGA